jgi:hypothetical protein
MSRSRFIAGLAGTAVLAMGGSAIAAVGPTITSLKTTQSGKSVVVRISTAYFTIDAKDVGKSPKAGKGHEHFSLDGGKFDFPKYSGANGKLAQQLGVQGMYSPSVTNQVTYKGLPKGKHTIVVHLVKNNHSNYGNKGATKKLTFTVR